jgi:hypothetical protein
MTQIHLDSTPLTISEDSPDQLCNNFGCYKFFCLYPRIILFTGALWIHTRQLHDMVLVRCVLLSIYELIDDC